MVVLGYEHLVTHGKRAVEAALQVEDSREVVVPARRLDVLRPDLPRHRAQSTAADHFGATWPGRWMRIQDEVVLLQEYFDHEKQRPPRTLL